MCEDQNENGLAFWMLRFSGWWLFCALPCTYGTCMCVCVRVLMAASKRVIYLFCMVRLYVYIENGMIENERGQMWPNIAKLRRSMGFTFMDKCSMLPLYNRIDLYPYVYQRTHIIGNVSVVCFFLFFFVKECDTIFMALERNWMCLLEIGFSRWLHNAVDWASAALL